MLILATLVSNYAYRQYKIKKNYVKTKTLI